MFFLAGYVADWGEGAIDDRIKVLWVEWATIRINVSELGAPGFVHTYFLNWVVLINGSPDSQHMC